MAGGLGLRRSLSERASSHAKNLIKFRKRPKGPWEGCWRYSRPGVPFGQSPWRRGVR